MFNRRQFLATGVATTAGMVVGPGQTATAAPIKACLLGGAHANGPAKARMLIKSTDWDLVGVADADAAILARYGELGAPLAPVEELLKNCDVAVVESPVSERFKLAKRALEAGKHVHLERPPTLTLEEFQELQILAKSGRRLLQLGYALRFDPALSTALEIARQGWLGNVYHVRGAISAFVPRARRAEMNMRGGAMFEFGSRLIDPVVRLLGRPEKVTAHLKSTGGGDRVTDNAVAVFDYQTATAVIFGSLLQPGGGDLLQLEIRGRNGTAQVRLGEESALELQLDQPGGPYQPGRHELDFPSPDLDGAVFSELAGAIRHGKPLGVAPETELLVHETLLRACGVESSTS